jgi:hypothetical protein
VLEEHLQTAPGDAVPPLQRLVRIGDDRAHAHDARRQLVHLATQHLGQVALHVDPAPPGQTRQALERSRQIGLLLDEAKLQPMVQPT